MRLCTMAAALVCAAVGARARGGDAPEFVFGAFDDPADLAVWEAGDAGARELSVGPRTPNDLNNMLKMVVKSGQYPGIATYPPKIPKDWGPYETLSFVVWSPSDTFVAIRVDDEKSFNYNSRYNGGMNVQKGRSLIQVPVKTIAKNIDVSRIKALIIFAVEPPPGQVLWFDDFTLGPFQSAKVDFIPYEQRYDLVPSMEVVSPHLAMARPLAGGPVRTFMLTSVRFGREVVEMMERMDLQVSPLTWDRQWGANTWGFGDFYGKRGHSHDYALMQRYLDSSMQGPERFEAMVMYTPLGWNRFTPSARAKIVERVKERGEGLVLVMPFPGEDGEAWPADLAEVSALVGTNSDWMDPGANMKYARGGRIQGRKWVKAKPHPITAGVPLGALPFAHMEVQEYRPAPGAEVLVELETGQPVVAVRRCGKGRVVTIAARSASLTPIMAPPEGYPNEIPHRFWEAWYSLENRAILWAAGREFSRAGDPVPLDVEGANADPGFAVRQWKNAEGEVTDWELVFKPVDEDVARFEVNAPEAVGPGNVIRVSFSPPAGTEGAEWTAVLGERSRGRWRTMEREAFDLASLTSDGAGALALELATERIRGHMAYVRIEARKNGRPAAVGKAEVVVTPGAPWDEYHVHTWLESGLPFLQELEMRRMREFGLTANTTSPWDVNTCRRLFRGGMRVHGCGFTGGLHARDIKQQERDYAATKDKKHLVRNPSYADSDFVAAEQGKVREYCAKLAPFRPLSMILSDETALTSYTMDFDLDFHPANVKAFRERMRAKFGDVSAFNAALGTDLGSFDEVEPPTTDEARASGNWGLWNEWRSHNDDMWTGAFKMYGEAMTSALPGARVSVSGSQESAVFNGIDWAKLAPALAAISGYGGRFQELKRLSFHPGDQRVTPWGGYGRSGRSVDYQLWKSLTTGGDGMGLFWWYSLRNADLTFCKSAKDYRRVFAEMQAGLGKQFMMSTRDFSPVAVLWSARSQRAAWTLGSFDEFKKTEARVVNALHAAGFDPLFVSDEAVAAGELKRRGTRAVVMPMTLALGRGGKRGGAGVLSALEKLVASGGTVMATHDARFDEFLQPTGLPRAFAERLVRFSDVEEALGAALGKAGARQWVRIRSRDGGGVPGVTATVHRIPGGTEARILTLLRPPVGTKEVVGADGVIHSVPDDSSGREVETCVLDVSRFEGMSFYDMRGGGELKPKRGEITVEMRAGDGRPIAVLPYARPRLEARSAVDDRYLTATWRLETDGATSFPRHVVRVDVVDRGSGQVDIDLGLNSVGGADGKGVVRIPLAYEDEGRDLEVRLRDCLTGIEWSSIASDVPVDGRSDPRAPAAAGRSPAPAPAEEEPKERTAAAGRVGVVLAVLLGAAVLAAAVVVASRSRRGRRTGRGRRAS